MNPRTLNRSRDAIPPGAVYVGRPTKWGNPFVIGRDGNREQVVTLFGKYLNDRPELIAAARAELRGRDLVCFCAPQLCHADVLRVIANT
jgi:hypothetical protein